jgi:uncharacterized protein (TIGR03435 family)
MHRLTTSVVGLLVASLLASTPHAQRPTFEVASIKRNLSGTLNSGMNNQPGGRVTVINMSLRQLVRGMYRLPEYQVVNNAGDWLLNERWDITTKAEGDPPFEQLVLMLRALVIERFSLVTHQERRDMPIYALVMARANRAPGPALRPSTRDCSVPNTCNVFGDPGVLKATGRTMEDLARNLAQMNLGRMVVNRTNLPGAFDIELMWNDTEGPSIFTALQEQLGLKLESDRAPADVLVIDSAKRPMED